MIQDNLLYLLIKLTFHSNIRFKFYLLLFFFLLESGINFKLVGNGWCRSQRYVSGSPCIFDAYLKEPSNYYECKSACEKESACNGFAISSSTYSVPNRCFVYGNLSFDTVSGWNTPDDWIAYNQSTFGFNGYEVDSSSDTSGVRCFKRLNLQNQINGKFQCLLLYEILHIITLNLILISN